MASIDRSAARTEKRLVGGGFSMLDQEKAPARWKSLVIAAIALLVIAGWFVVIFTLPIVTGSVEQ